MMILLRMECAKALRNKWFLIALTIGVAVAMVAAYDNVANYFERGYDQLDLTEYQFTTGKSCYGMWMGISSMSVSPARELFFYLVLLLAAVPYAWSMRAELMSGYAAQVFTRAPRGSYCAAKGFAVFLTGGLMAFVPLLANFVAVACFVPARPTHIYDVMYVGLFGDALWANLFYTWPLAFVLARCVLGFVICGVWAYFVFGLSFLIKNRVVLMVAPYLGMHALAFVNHYFFPAAGGLVGFEMSLFDLMQCLVLVNKHDGFVLAVELLAFFAVSIVLCVVGTRRDAL